MKVSNWEVAIQSSGPVTPPLQMWEGVRALPTLSSSLFRFLGLVGDPGRGMDELADYVCQDPALLARVLPLIPQGFAGADASSPTLRESIMAFGRERIQALAKTTPLIRTSASDATGTTASNSFYASMLWERSISCSLAAQAAATRLQLVRPERYYVAGLLHDIGYLVVLQKSPAQFFAVVRGWSQRQAGLLELEKKILGASHCEIGAQVGRQLNIPEWFLPAIEHHHAPGLDEARVSTVVAAAAAFCNWQNLDLFPRQVLAPSAFSGGFRVREARMREMHDILRGLFPQLIEIERHRLLDAMLAAVRPARHAFKESFGELAIAGSALMRPYGYARRPEAIAAVA